jgi:hypothetical protein
MSYKVYSGTGTLFLAPVNSSGVKTAGFRQVGDAYPLSIQVATKKTEVKSRMVERAGQVIASKVEIDTIKGSLTLREWNAANMAWALSGTASILSAAGASITDEVVTMPVPGEYHQLGGATPRRNISAVSVNNQATPATTYSATTDYQFDAVTGLITSRVGGLLAAGTVACVVDYTYAAQSDYRVTIGDQVQIRCAFLCHLYDEYRAEHYTLELDSVVMSASQEINFISEEGSEGEQIQFDLTLETLSGASSPGRIDGVPI